MEFGSNLVAGILLVAVFHSAFVLGDSGPTELPSSLSIPPTVDAIGDGVSVPLGFIENRGQLLNDAVRYYANAGGVQIGLAAGVVFAAVGDAGNRGVLVSATFEGANPTIPEGRDPLPLRTHYFRGADPAGWRADVPSFSEVEYPDLYRGIDLRYRVAPGGVKYEFRVDAGADPDRIRIAYAGADRLTRARFRAI